MADHVERSRMGAAENACLLRASFARAVPDPVAFTAGFYTRMFALSPNLRSLFPAQLHLQQQEKFAHTLATLLGFLDSPQILADSLRQLGARHRSYGATPGHFAVLGEALIGTLDASVGGPLTPAERAAWLQLYAWITAQMLAGLQGVARSEG